MLLHEILAKRLILPRLFTGERLRQRTTLRRVRAHRRETGLFPPLTDGFLPRVHANVLAAHVIRATVRVEPDRVAVRLGVASERV